MSDKEWKLFLKDIEKRITKIINYTNRKKAMIGIKEMKESSD